MGWIFVKLDLRCPFCGAHVPQEHPFGEPFVCLNCEEKLQASVRSAQMQMLASVFIALAASAVLGARGWWLMVLAAVLLFPAILVSGEIFLRFFPPKLERWDGRKIV